VREETMLSVQKSIAGEDAADMLLLDSKPTQTVNADNQGCVCASERLTETRIHTANGGGKCN